jgi:dTDP-4-amino-4,6-dideoxygalactose transaminase
VHGKGSDSYDNARIGMNSRLVTIQAAILLEKLNEFPIEIFNRGTAAKKYESKLASKYTTPQVADGYTSSWAQYTLVSNDRDDEMVNYKMKGIQTIIYYSTCMHQQSVFSNLDYKPGDFPMAGKLAKTLFSLPMDGYLV